MPGSVNRAHRSRRRQPHVRVAPPEPRTTDLSPAWRALLDVCRGVGFGAVHALTIRGGEPTFTVDTTVVRTVKLAHDREPIPPADHEACALRREVLELVAHAQRIGDGVIERIDVVAGLPKSFQLRGPVAEVMRV